MSASVDEPEPMDYETSCASEDEDEAQLVLSLKWEKPDKPQKRMEKCLEIMLQSWFNKNINETSCSVVRTLKNGSVVIKIKPVPVLTKLQKLSGQVLTKSDRNTATVTIVTIIAISLTVPPSEQDSQIPEASMNPCPSMPEYQTEQVPLEEQSNGGSAAGEASGTSPMAEHQTEQVQPGEQSNGSSAAGEVSGTSSMAEYQTEEDQPEKKSIAGSAAGEEKISQCSIPLGHFWYVNHIYKEEMIRIAQENGVEMNADVNVRFKSHQKSGNPDTALNEFTNVVQKSLAESSGSVIPLKDVDLALDQWRDAMEVIQKKENKLLITLASEEMTVRGPSHAQDVISKSLNAVAMRKTNTNASLNEYKNEFEDIPLKINMTTKDDLIHTELTMEGGYWKLMTTSYCKEIEKIKAKFNVDIKDSEKSQDKVSVKVFYKRNEGKASMEIHALKAILRLYQKTATSLMSFFQSNGATGFSGSPMNTNSISQSEVAPSEPVLSGQSENRMHNTDAPTDDRAKTGDKKDEICPICLDTFKHKNQLKCKHDFCEKCLQQAVEANGPICPVCRVVFGKIMGDQPKGEMSHQIFFSPLPGFPDCDTIRISYVIPDGIQTETHPNPGQRYWGIKRFAYLPNNREGNEVLQLLKRAFAQKLIFTIGTSRTTGLDDQVTWNDIHHKTSMSGGPQGFGYPDPNYLSRVKEELKAKGIK